MATRDPRIINSPDDNRNVRSESDNSAITNIVPSPQPQETPSENQSSDD